VKALPRLATTDEIIELLNSINNSAELAAVLAPMRLPRGLSDFDKGRLTSAVVVVASRCWKRRSS